MMATSIILFLTFVKGVNAIHGATNHGHRHHFGYDLDHYSIHANCSSPGLEAVTDRNECAEAAFDLGLPFLGNGSSSEGTFASRGCYLELDLTGTSGVVFIEGDEADTNLPPPPGWKRVCAGPPCFDCFGAKILRRLAYLGAMAGLLVFVILIFLVSLVRSRRRSANLRGRSQRQNNPSAARYNAIIPRMPMPRPQSADQDVELVMVGPPSLPHAKRVENLALAFQRRYHQNPRDQKSEPSNYGVVTEQVDDGLTPEMKQHLRGKLEARLAVFDRRRKQSTRGRRGARGASVVQKRSMIARGEEEEDGGDEARQGLLAYSSSTASASSANRGRVRSNSSSMKVCPSCQALNFSDVQKCDACGADLKTSISRPPHAVNNGGKLAFETKMRKKVEEEIALERLNRVYVPASQPLLSQQWSPRRPLVAGGRNTSRTRFSAAPAPAPAASLYPQLIPLSSIAVPSSSFSSSSSTPYRFPSDRKNPARTRGGRVGLGATPPTIIPTTTTTTMPPHAVRTYPVVAVPAAQTRRSAGAPAAIVPAYVVASPVRSSGSPAAPPRPGVRVVDTVIQYPRTAAASYYQSGGGAGQGQIETSYVVLAGEPSAPAYDA
mmetsp:Transcript_31025/g.49909  ORF Transcript_31025/g.49909 Transcript_31025/m.49909 type:complete len:606 (+) Transcript_31025:38-1855(+)